ncbi:cell division protein ZapD [Comamonas sp. Y33R10-2]|uniref:cell division protein ZapD n=1 Tax=Comamonas sp. Y33R10-2 TaxID=2853257 RepID=UPI001C5C9FA9|nr:cell division protein ZapD [Comamonas sp. Y33R10-2]QXZ09903.1 cell division protein ZapD [Comamonas sp. Y33R10-2]
MILYEYPFNERLRTYLRLEQLYRRLGELLTRAHSVDHHFALTTIFEIMDVASRSDLRLDVIKDLERQKNLLDVLRDNPDISQHMLHQVTRQVESCVSAINSQIGKTGQTLAENEWLIPIRSRLGIPGGTCSFDLPAYHAWHNLDPRYRQRDLEDWAAELTPLGQSLDLILQLLRETGIPQRVVAEQGLFQQAMPAGRNFQLLRLRIDRRLNLAPEISGNRLMLSVRLLQLANGCKPQPSSEDASFELTLCA